MTDLSADQVRRLRTRSQLLAGGRARSVAGVVRAVGALQAQDTRASRLAVRCRSSGLDAAAVKRACGQERSVVRTWLMRGTLHMVPAEDAGWLIALLGPTFAAAGRRRRLELGLDDETCARALVLVRDILTGRPPLSRSELVDAVLARGLRLDPTGQAPAHLVAYAAMRGLVCRGPDRDDEEPTYVLLHEWVGEQPGREPEDALAELARRYVAGHGPAGVRDFACWAGIGPEAARRGFRLIAGELAEVEIAGEAAWMPAEREVPDVPAGGPTVRLLAAFDAYLLGYRSRDLALPARFARRIQAGGGWIHPAVCVDGRVVGTWRQERRGDRLTVRAEPFEELRPDVVAGLEAEVADVGRFLGREAVLAFEPDGWG